MVIILQLFCITGIPLSLCPITPTTVVELNQKIHTHPPPPPKVRFMLFEIRLRIGKDMARNSHHFINMDGLFMSLE